MRIETLVKSLTRWLKRRGDQRPGYRGAEIALATLHRKEQVMSRFFKRYLGASVLVANVDTDTLGTFSGEVERKAPAREVAILKAKLGMEALSLARGMATEGSFGPHPIIPGVSIHHELIAFIDREAGIEVIEQQLFMRSVYDSIELCSFAEAQDFLTRNRFGRYGVIVQAKLPSASDAIKGIKTTEQLKAAISQVQSSSSSEEVRLLTDMRAHMNPLRMWRIRAVTRALVHRLMQSCPACNTPGWGETGREAGLPCERCGAKTEGTYKRIFSCSACRYEQRLARLDNRCFATAQECPRCSLD